MAGSNSLMSIEKLTGRDNWANWSFAVKAYLQHEDLYDCILKAPDDSDPKAIKQDTKAKSKLILLVDPVLYVHIQDAQNAKQVWDNLTKAFEDQGLTRKVGLLKELINTNLESSLSVEDYVNKIMTAAHKLRNIKFHVDDEWLGTLMLAGLPEMYRPMIMGLESSGMKISADLVKNKLLQEVKMSDTTALYTNTRKNLPKSDKKGPRCFNCNKYGHLSKNCWHKKTNNNKKTDKDTGYVAAFSASTANDSNSWHVDSGASMHMTMHRDWLTDITASPVPSIRIANNKELKVECCGNVCIKVKAHDGNTDLIQVRNVLFVPELKTNLLSVSKIIQSGCKVIFNESGCQIYNPSNKLVAQARLINATYLLNTYQEMQVMMAKADDDTYLWHQRMGHLNFQSLNKIPNCTEGVKLSPGLENSICVTCLEGKQTRKPFPAEGSRATSLLELIHSDVCGPMQQVSIGGARYFVTFIDDFSRRVYIYPIKNKSEVFEKFVEYKNRVENELNKKIKILRSDNGTEYKNNNFDTYLKKHGILHQTSNPYSPEQNGLSERMNRTLIERAKCMLLNSGLQKDFWAEAVTTAAYIVNRSPTRSLSDATPYEVWTGKKPNLNHMRIFGCPAMVHIPKENRSKLDVKSRKLIFVGYSDCTKGYKFIDPETKKGIVSRDVVFLEAAIKRNKTDEPEKEKEIIKNKIENTNEDNKKNNEHKEKKNLYLPLCDEPEESVGRNIDDETQERDEIQDVSQSICISDESDQFEDVNDETYVPDYTMDSPSVSNITLRPLQRRIRSENNDIYQNPSSLMCQNVESTMNLLNSDPQSLQEALNSDKADEWKKAMEAEYQSLIQNNTWTTVNLPEGKSVIPCRWVFKTKLDVNGSVTRYKARLVIKGYKQVKGIDYNEVYAPVVRYTSIRYLIGLAAKYRLKIHQMDAVTAFLQGEIDEELYMSLPPGYEDENKVCRLNKSIYGLKQASRQWNKKLNSALLQIGMTRSNIDPCVYYRILNENDMLFIAVYVDDILYFYNKEETSDMIKEKLKEKFNMKDLGKAKHCIGFKISQDEDEISIDQSIYIKLILTRFGMDKCKPMWTPADPNVKLKKAEGQQEILKNIPYQEIIGCLLYLSQGTRPDITYIVNSLSRYNSQPTSEHWAALKRVLRYLKATMDMKLVYKRNVDERISGYCDSDWANDTEDRRSCTGYIFLFQGAAISWNSKKQQTIALSTSEAEYMALASAIQEALWLKQLADEFQPEFKGTPLTLYCDNQSAISLSGNAVYHARSKHIDVRYHFVREKIAAKEILVQYRCTGEMVADILTKGLPRPKHDNFTASMGLHLKRLRPGEDVRSMDAYAT